MSYTWLKSGSRRDVFLNMWLARDRYLRSRCIRHSRTLPKACFSSTDRAHCAQKDFSPFLDAPTHQQIHGTIITTKLVSTMLRKIARCILHHSSTTGCLLWHFGVKPPPSDRRTEVAASLETLNQSVLTFTYTLYLKLLFILGATVTGASDFKLNFQK